MARYVVLLRGINLARSRRVAMADLRALLADRGYEDVVTHLQSGNVLLSTSVAAASLPARLEAELAEGLGMDIPVVVRSRAQVAKVVATDPFGDVAGDAPKLYMVTFFPDKPDAKAVKALLAEDFGAERVAASGREIYSWHPDGIQKSKLARAVGDRRLGPGGTGRNWNTVTKLLELASA
jgi:uncharacterized protein (DUF1697 family)